MQLTSRKATVAALIGLLPVAVQAHFFVQPYVLPVPFSMYAFGAIAALAASFAMAGAFAAMPGIPDRFRVTAVSAVPAEVQDVVFSTSWQVARATSALSLLLSIVSGLVGTPNPFTNINMTLFWIVFVLAIPYSVAIVGDYYATINPWRVLADWLQSAGGLKLEGRVRYPERLAHYPAFILYVAFITIELFAGVGPRGLSIALIGYSAVALAGCWLFGKSAWFCYGDLFGILMRLLGSLSPRSTLFGRRDSAGPRWRLPFLGLNKLPPPDISLTIFVLFMLSSTAFDGVHSTLPWVTLFWKGIYPHIAPLLGDTEAQRVARSTTAYYWWQWISLVVSPFVYLVVYASTMWSIKHITRCDLSVPQLMRQFTMSLVPIALVYHVCHYYTLLVMQVAQMLPLVSDPFGFGWDIIGTANWQPDPILLDVGTVWHTQVALLLLGHVVSVFLAHMKAVEIFSDVRVATVSQVPLLLLMAGFTAFGLWILSLPIA